MANKNTKDTIGTVYMVMEDVRGARTVKVGFTNNIARRMREYASHSTTIKLIGMTEGTLETEKSFQAQLESMGFVRVNEFSEFFTIPRMYSKKWVRENGFGIFN